MTKLVRILAGLLIGYGLGALLGWFLVGQFSPNTHDRSLEAAMTAGVITGPIGALIGALVAGFTGRRPQP